MLTRLVGHIRSVHRYPVKSMAGESLDSECVVPAPRCSMVAQAQPGLDKDPMILRTIVRQAAQNLGIYARVRREGRVSVGAPVELVSQPS